MKIGIMTFWWSEDNYGQILQCYALQKYLRDAGHDAYLIRYDPKNDYIKLSIFGKILKAFNPVKLNKYLKIKKQKILDMYEKQKNPRNFDEFRNKYNKQSERIYHSYNELVDNPPEADMYITGSDQVWNTFGVSIERAINVIKAYLLDFGTSSIRRFAYAASFGKEKLDNASVKVFVPLLKKFDYISVREKTGLDICKQCGIDSAEWVPDPTMLLDADIYRTLYKNEKMRKYDKPFCFLYLVEDYFIFSVQKIYNWAEKKGIDVVYITGNGRQDKYKKTYATIPEWVYLLEHAEYVITNSYHCSVFSLLFKKKFAVIPNEKELKGTNTRLNSLFELFEIENRFIDIDFSVLDNEIHWQFVSNTFQNIKSNCKLNSII